MPSRSNPRRGRLLVQLALGVLLTVAFSYVLVRRSLGDGGILQLAPHEVAVRFDLISGEEVVLDAPGTHAFMPWKQEVHRLDRRPIEYILEGNEHATPTGGPRVILRARDGSCYGFPRVVLQLALEPSLAPLVLRDLGTEADVRPLLGPMLRSSLREAFGAFTVEQVLDPVNRSSAIDVARASLSERLASHGYALLELSLSQPSFSPKYEETIARRQVAEQDTARKRHDAETLQAGIADRLEQLRRERSLALTTLDSKRRAELEAARRKAEHLKAKAVALHAASMAEVQRESESELAQIALQEQRVLQEIEALRAHATALADHGDRVVREAWVEKLASVQFEFETPPVLENGDQGKN